MPLRGEKLQQLISKFEHLEQNNFQGKIKLRCGWLSINFVFGGLDSIKGIKVKSYIIVFFFYGSSFGNSYISPNLLTELINNLKRCL